MARSVNYLNSAVAVAYIPTNDFVGSDDDYDYEFLWDEAISDVVSRLSEIWPSFEADSGWNNRETRIVASNGHAIVGVSEYCGLTSISIAVNESSECPELSEAWINRISEKFEETFGSLRRIGVFSNGEAVYECKAS